MVKRKSLASALRNHREGAAKSASMHAKVAAQHQKKQTHGRRRALMPFQKDDRILFLGEGNFSFAASCVENHLEHAEGVLATCFDDEETLSRKYEDASQHIQTILDCCGQVRYNVDATQLHRQLKGHTFDSVVFLFPHVAAGIADEDRNILTNQKMLTQFFKSVQSVLKGNGRVSVALAVSRTYDLWDLRGIAKSQGMTIETSGPFDGSQFPGYSHRKTTGQNGRDFSGGKGEERSARLHIFSVNKHVTPESKDDSDE